MKSQDASHYLGFFDPDNVCLKLVFAEVVIAVFTLGTVCISKNLDFVEGPTLLVLFKGFFNLR